MMMTPSERNYAPQPMKATQQEAPASGPLEASSSQTTLPAGLTSQNQLKPVLAQAGKCQTAWDMVGIEKGNFLGVQGGLSLVTWGQKLLLNQDDFRDFTQTTHIATVVDVTSDKIKILEASDRGIDVSELSDEEFRARYIDNVKAGIAVIKVSNNEQLADKVIDVATDIAHQYDDKTGKKGTYGYKRFLTGAVGKVGKETEEGYQVIAHTLNAKEGGRYVLSKSETHAKTNSVCSELAMNILKIAQAAVAIEEERDLDAQASSTIPMHEPSPMPSVAPTEDQAVAPTEGQDSEAEAEAEVDAPKQSPESPPLAEVVKPKTDRPPVTVDKIRELSEQGKIAMINSKKATPSVFMHTAEGLQFKITMVSKNDSRLSREFVRLQAARRAEAEAQQAML